MKTTADADIPAFRMTWTLSNVLTLSRIVLVLPIAFFLGEATFRGRALSVMFMLAAVATDFLDGYCARVRNEVTEFGKLLDPVADKIATGVVILYLVLQGLLPVWFVVAILVRDVLILLGGLMIASRKRVIVQSNWTGKWAMAAVALTIISATMAWHVTTDLLLAVSAVMLLWSFLSYVARYRSIVHQSPQQ